MRRFPLILPSRADSIFGRDRYLYSKPPFGGPEAVLAYLSRYTHRVAISNRRLFAFDHNGVTFKYKAPAIVLVLEGDAVVVERKQPAAGDGDAWVIARQNERHLWSAERGL